MFHSTILSVTNFFHFLQFPDSHLWMSMVIKIKLVFLQFSTDSLGLDKIN